MSERRRVEHYCQGEIEFIDAVRSALTDDEFRGFLKGSIIKYLWRERHKGKSKEDCGKAHTYAGWLIEHVE